MKRILSVLLASLCILTGCSKGESVDSMQEKAIYKALPLPELYLEIPEDFETTSSQFYEEYYIKDDASVIITEDTAGAPFTSVYDYAIGALVKYKEITSDLEITNEEMVYSGDLGIQILEFHYTMGENETILEKSTMVGFLTDSKSMYIITCKSDVENYESYRDDFLGIIQSASLVK